ncbi:hypothetical protein NQD34_004872 [Periophthalmus magnuspinnatus]|nr:hypothetical protein NQD34_004872 [Periophthalmus magnuspinnatus]
MSEPTWLTADRGPSSDLSPGSRAGDRRRHSKDDDDDSSSESGSGNGLPTLTPPTSIVRETEVINSNGVPAPLDFSTPTSSSSSCEEQQPVALPPSGQRLALSSAHLPVTVSAAAAALLGALHPAAPEELRRKYPLSSKPPLAWHPALPLPLPHNAHTPAALSQSHASELRLERDARDYGSKSPQYSSGGSYESVNSVSSVKMDLSAEDLTMGRHGNQATPDDDDDDHDDHDDTDKMNDAEGVDPERLKAFNMFVRLFVDENLDRMVPISKQPKEKIQAIIESCSRQFPEFQERARKRIRTYLKSCRRMKKNGMETRPTPPHLTSAMAENILAAACESESRNAAKRMRLETYHEDLSLEKPSAVGLREPASLAHSAYSLAASAFSSQDSQLYINGAGLSYGYRTYPTMGAMTHPVSLTTTQTNGPTDLSMKSLSSTLTNSHNANSLGGAEQQWCGGRGRSFHSAQPTGDHGCASAHRRVPGVRRVPAPLR